MIKTLITSLIFFAATAFAAEAIPEGGTGLFGSAQLPLKNMHVRLQGGKLGTSKTQAVQHPSFKESLKLNITKRPPNTWDAAMGAKITTPIKKGDALLFGFWARGKALDGVGGAVAEFVVERAGNPYTKSVQYLVETPEDGGWQHYWIRCRSLEDYAPNGVQVNYQLGYLPAEFEIAGFEGWNFGDRHPLHKLPYTELTYVGRKPDAAWRAEAAKRIDQHRKADLEITVLDANNNPAPGVTVDVHMDRLAFDFGTCVKSKLIADTSPANDQYCATLLKYFNLAVIENGLKWAQWEKHPGNRKHSVAALEWLQQQDMPVRGHVMVWPGYKNLPPSVKALGNDKAAVRQSVLDHIAEMGEVTRGLVRDWDVLNEVYDNRDLTNLLGDGAMIEWFDAARKAMGDDVKLYYNDYAPLVRGGFPTGHKDHYEQTLRYLIDNKAKIDGMGLQGHFGSLLTPPSRLYAELDRWHALGLPMLVTEFDVTVPNERLRADYTRDFLTLCFSHPGMTGILVWGFWEPAQWRPEAAFFKEDWSLTPVGEQWVELVGKQWRTDAQLVSDDEGKVKLRAFQGKYTATAKGVSTEFFLGKSAAFVQLPLK